MKLEFKDLMHLFNKQAIFIKCIGIGYMSLLLITFLTDDTSAYFHTTIKAEGEVTVGFWETEPDKQAAEVDFVKEKTNPVYACDTTEIKVSLKNNSSDASSEELTYKNLLQ